MKHIKLFEGYGKPTLCDKTFDDLKTKATPNTSWTLTKKDGEWSLTLGDFCTKDIIIYGVTQPLTDNLETSVIRIDDTKNKIYFNGFNVGSKNNQPSTGTEQSVVEGCPTTANYEFFQNMFIQYPSSRYKEIKLDTNKNIISISLSEDGIKVMKEYKCQSHIKFDTNQDLTTTIPDLTGYTDVLYIVGITENKVLSIRGGFYLNKGKPFTIQLN